MFDNVIALNQILVSFEGTLKIEMSGDQKVQSIIEQAVARLENSYSCKFDRTIFELQAENQLLADSMNTLLRDIEQCLAMLSLYTSLKMYHKNIGISLADVNYLGYAKELLMRSLQYIRDETEAQMYRKEIIQPLYNTLNNISICSIKRLFIILLMLDRLGIYEGVSIVADLLYLGGLVA